MIPGKQGPRGHKGEQGVKGAPGEGCDCSRATEVEVKLNSTAERCTRVERLLEELKERNDEMAQRLKELSGLILMFYFVKKCVFDHFF